jgi:uncharacterized protein with GYD domain
MIVWKQIPHHEVVVGGSVMGKYLGLVRYAGPAVKEAGAHPAVHKAALDKATQSVGGQVVASYWMLGTFDLVAVLECPDAVSAKAVHLAVMAGGAATHAEVYPILDDGEAETLVSRVQDAAAAYKSTAG